MSPKFSFFLLTALAWPLALSQLSAGVLSDAEAVGLAFGQLSALGQRAPKLELELPAPVVQPSAQKIQQAVPEPPQRAKKPTPVRRRAPQKGIRVKRNRVLRLANAGVLPKGTPVAASGGRPAGIQLSGVGALGVGLKDGDVLTRVGGVAVSASAQVVSRVLAVRARQAPQISAVFYRGSVPWQLVVEMPYVAAR